MGRIARRFLVLALLYGLAHSQRDPESGHCSEDGCPADDGEPRGGRGGGDELENVGDGSAQKWNIFSSISDAIISFKDTVKYNAYKKLEGMYNTTAEFADNIYSAVEDFSERVRSVFREEFSSFLDIMWESAVGTDPANSGADSLYLKFKRVVVNRVLAVGLILLCLILNYFIWIFSYSAFTATIFILTFNSSVALGYKIVGPLWVYWFFWKVVGYVWYTVSCMWTYPYTSAGVICGLFLFATLYSVYQWRRRVERREWNEDMIRSIALRLQRMEEQQNKILKQNEDLK
ncbi:hypothetical protein GBAR_LOCUS16309, partial [Geodia barretti]